MRNIIHLNINGQDFSINDPDPELSLAFYLRRTVGLTGCKIACEEGSCGSCTVVVAEYAQPRPNYKAVNACLFPLWLADGKFVITVEGVGNKSKIHEVQKRLALGNGTQCGFCSPGFVMSMYALLMETAGKPTISEINQAIKGNLCRCTGYRPIIEAFQSFADSGCCKGKTGQGCPCKTNDSDVDIQSTPANFSPLHETQNLIFPASLIENKPKTGLILESKRVALAAPISLSEFHDVLNLFNSRSSGFPIKFVSSGLLTRFESFYQTEIKEQWICINFIPEFQKIEITEDFLSVGAASTIRELSEYIKKHCDSNISKAFISMYNNFSSHQVFNASSWAGALSGVNISDTEVLSRALKAKVVLRDRNQKTIEVEAGTKLRELVKEGCFIERIYIPRHLDGKFIAGKYGDRPGPDATYLNYAMLIRGSQSISESCMIFSDRKTVIQLNGFEKMIMNKTFEDLATNHADWLETSQHQIENAFGTAQWQLVRGIVSKSFGVHHDVTKNGLTNIEEKLASVQIFTAVDDNQPAGDGVGRPLSHMSCEIATTGEATFHGDLKFGDMVHIAMVLSTIPKGKIISIDASKALATDGVIAFYDYKDIPANGNNFCAKQPYNALYDDTPVFANGQVEYVGQPIGIVVATNVEIARRAVNLVDVTYEKEEAIIELKDALEKESWLFERKVFGKEVDEVEAEIKKCEVILEGETEIDGQQHIYLETQTAIAKPGDHDEIIIHSSTQAMSNVHLLTACFLGLPSNKVVVQVKRVGGAFGGKCAQSVQPSCYAALTSLKLKKTASCVYSREEDFLITGGRHPAYIKYRLGADRNGRLHALDYKLYLDGGAFIDHSEWVVFVGAGIGADACYHIPYMRVEGYGVKTNKTSHTAMRGFGNPQATYAIECMLKHLSVTIKKDLVEIKELNFNKVGLRTNMGNLIHSDSMHDVWRETKQFSNYEKLKKDVSIFNSNNKFKKRGISMSSVRYGMTHGGYMEQAAALVQIFLDGSVAVSIGGIEMGQGLSVKIQQVASRALDVPISHINILCGSTDKTANAPETGGSQGTDLHGRAVQAACLRLREGIDPLRCDSKSWPEVVLEAYQKKLPLQATENISIDRKKYGIEENRSTYFTTGAACVVVELDCRTGDHILKTVDIVMDVGKSVNPAIDIGQIEGAFVQGYGQFVCESMPYDKQNGRPLLDSLYKYRAPTPCMVPQQFRIKLMKDGPTFPECVYSSKGIGEPPLLLAIAVYSGLLNAIEAACPASEKFIQYNAPLTRNKILKILNEKNAMI